MLDNDHDIRTVLAEYVGSRAHTRRSGNKGVDLTATRAVGQCARCGDCFQRTLSQRRTACFREYKNVGHGYSTFASVCRRRMSSGIAAVPSPMIRPAGRSGGSSIVFTVTRTVPSCAGFVSSGFFFAAMMPLSDG